MFERPKTLMRRAFLIPLAFAVSYTYSPLFLSLPRFIRKKGTNKSEDAELKTEHLHPPVIRTFCYTDEKARSGDQSGN